MHEIVEKIVDHHDHHYIQRNFSNGLRLQRDEKWHEKYVEY